MSDVDRKFYRNRKCLTGSDSRCMYGKGSQGKNVKESFNVLSNLVNFLRLLSTELIVRKKSKRSNRRMYNCVLILY